MFTVTHPQKALSPLLLRAALLAVLCHGPFDAALAREIPGIDRMPTGAVEDIYRRRIGAEAFEAFDVVACTRGGAVGLLAFAIFAMARSRRFKGVARDYDPDEDVF